MSEPNESHFESEESEALSIANDLAGGDDWQVEEGGMEEAGGAAPPTSGQPAGPAAQGAPGAAPLSPAQPSLTLEQARQRWQQTNLTRAQLRQQLDEQALQMQQAQAQRQQYEEMANAILRASQQQQVQQQEPPQIDPELQRYFDQRLEAQQQQFQALLQPVLTQAQQAQVQQEVQQQVSHEQQQWGEFRQMVDQAERDYMATPEGAGYMERITGFEKALNRAGELAGADPRVVSKLVNEDMKGMAMIAMSLGISPPMFIDAYARAMFEWAQGAGQQPNGQQRPMQRQQGRVSPQVQIARMATQNGAVGAPPSNGAMSSGGDVPTVGDLMGRGLQPGDIDAAVKKYGSLDKAIKYFDKLGAELEEIGG
jgi:hypothetical protein